MSSLNSKQPIDSPEEESPVDEPTIQLNIAGKTFIVSKNDIMKYPSSTLAKKVKDQSSCVITDACSKLFRYVHRYILNGIKIDVSHIATQFGCTEDETKIMIDYWGYGDDIYTIREEIPVVDCSEPKVSRRTITEYVTAAAFPSNNGKGAQWYRREWICMREDKVSEEKYNELVQLIPADQVSDCNCGRSAAMFDPKKTPLVASEYMRRGWNKISEYTVMEEDFRHRPYCRENDNKVQPNYYNDDYKAKLPRLYVYLSREIEILVQSFD